MNSGTHTLPLTWDQGPWAVAKARWRVGGGVAVRKVECGLDWGVLLERQLRMERQRCTGMNKRETTSLGSFVCQRIYRSLKEKIKLNPFAAGEDVQQR